jgi:hypothetical protein
MVLAHSRSLCVVFGGTSEASDAVSTTVLQQTLAISGVNAAAREIFVPFSAGLSAALDVTQMSATTQGVGARHTV